MVIARGNVAFRSAKGRPFAERKATDGAKGDGRGQLSAGLSFEAMLRDIHMKLYGQLGRHHDHVKARPADAIATPTPNSPARNVWSDSSAI